jgi:hypothetical protein
VIERVVKSRAAEAADRLIIEHSPAQVYFSQHFSSEHPKHGSPLFCLRVCPWRTPRWVMADLTTEQGRRSRRAPPDFCSFPEGKRLSYSQYEFVILLSGWNSECQMLVRPRIQDSIPLCLVTAQRLRHPSPRSSNLWRRGYGKQTGQHQTTNDVLHF